jgi:hypothetical protein
MLTVSNTDALHLLCTSIFVKGMHSICTEVVMRLSPVCSRNPNPRNLEIKPTVSKQRNSVRCFKNAFLSSIVF